MVSCKKRRRFSLFSTLNYAFFVLISLVMLFPLWNVIVISLTDYREYVMNPLMLFPKQISWEA